MTPEPQIVVVGGDGRVRVAVLGALRKAGFPRAVSSDNLSLARDYVDLPDLLVICGPDVRLLCAEAREVPALADVPILAIVAAIPEDAGSGALAAGATDFVHDPPSPAVLGTRVRNLIRAGEARVRARHVEHLYETMVRIHGCMADAGDSPEGLRAALLIAVDALEFDRASLIAHVEGSANAYVIAATDDPTMSKFTLSVAKYPEVDAALRSGEPVLLNDAQNDLLTEGVANQLRVKGIRGVAVFPVVWKNRTLGVVLFRRARAGVEHLGPRKLEFGRMLAAQVAALLSHGHVMQSLKEQTGRISRARYEAERRLRTIDSLKEHFEHQADGVVVLDEEGRILFVNRTAEAITGFARDGLVGSPLVDLVLFHQREALQEIIRSVLDGRNVDAFDLDLTTTSGEAICVSVTTSTVLSSSGAVILTFRDVTAERALEAELRSTKEFLEKLIDSTVDAIVSADTHGNVILFNQGAERIYGYVADEVVGRIPVWELYQEGVAKQVMRMLRSMSYGGVGRLEQTRREILSKGGELVPVNMTASIVYDEDGREVATVGIFSDLRERIRIEQRLLQAQEKLQVTQKRALVAELAGAAAHELNQPLTSILGYAQLIQRQSEPDARHLRAIEVIIRESERMAGIVRKIGRITKFETKEYVGSTSILDLDKSAEATNPSLVLPDPDDLAAYDDDDDEPTVSAEVKTDAGDHSGGREP